MTNDVTCCRSSGSPICAPTGASYDPHTIVQHA